MIPLQLTLQNFLSYGEQPQSLDFTRFHVACLSGANGNGKSALLDAITWSLWGQARKGRHDRKPDEGLLRLGARQMRVEFTFELDTGTHRVIRSFRRRPRSNVSELELQIMDPDSGIYRPLSEAGAVSITQQRIDRLLSMDYETFINSAFLLQGHANAFTSKGAGERKVLLARILGLSRYDRLQDGAHKQHQSKAAELKVLKQRSATLAAELVVVAEVAAALANAEIQITDVGSSIKRSEEDLQLWRERRLRAETLRSEVDRCKSDAANIEASHERLKLEMARTEKHRQVDAVIIEQTDRIEINAVRLDHLQKEAAQLAAQQEADRGIESAANETRRQIDGARHQVEQRRTTWTARCESLDDRLRQFDSVLQNADQIETDHGALLRNRQDLDTMRRDRGRWEELRATREAATHSIELERRRLMEQRRGSETRLLEIQERIRSAAELSQQIEVAENDLGAAAKRAEEMRRLREEGTRLRAQTEQVRERLQELENESLELSERLASLGRGDLAECPMCGTDLDVDHRKRLDAELSEHEATLTTRRARLEQDAAAREEQLAALRLRFRSLEESAADLAQLQERVALLRARRRRLDEDEAIAARLIIETTGLTLRLQNEDFSLEEHRVVVDSDNQLSALEFKPERLTQLEDRVRDSVGLDGDHRLLLGARQDRVQTEAERLEAHGHAVAAQVELDSGSFARVLTAELGQLHQQQKTLGYDEARHTLVRAQLETLAETPVEVERLRSARERMSNTVQALARVGDELKANRSRAGVLVQRQAELVASLQQLTDVDDRCLQAQRLVDQLRSEYEHLLHQRGSLQTRQQQLSDMAEEAATVAMRRSEVERDEWLFAQLMEAFGKDGIQALIIESAIPEIEDETNAILRRLTDNRIQVTIESLRDLKSGGSRETLDIKISDELGERSYDLYSGGEAFRTDFALRIALSKVLARRAGTRLRTLIIDEGFGTQDARGLEQLTEAIQQISKDFDKVIVVTHLEEMKNAFPVRIEVEKNSDRGSHFEIVE